jgi:hypothetical protein
MWCRLDRSLPDRRRRDAWIANQPCPTNARGLPMRTRRPVGRTHLAGIPAAYATAG